MGTKIAINGFGRIGRLVFRGAMAREGLEVTAINDLTDAKTLAYLLKYDSVHSRYLGDVSAGDGTLIIDGKEIKVLAEKDPTRLPWKELGIDIIVEATGRFRARAECQWHIDAGAKKVILTVPAKDEIDATVVLGVNDTELTGKETILSNASCTTNCIAPIAKVLHDSFGIVKGLMTTVHGYTNDQSLHDFPHTDLRRARAAAVSIIPTTTGAAKTVGKIIPALKGKLDGLAMRVPVIDGSIVDLVCEVTRDTTVEAVHHAMKAAAEGPMKGILEYTEDPIVSIDVVGNPASSIYDAGGTIVIGGNQVKVLSWYDNEWGYSSRVVDLIEKIA